MKVSRKLKWIGFLVLVFALGVLMFIDWGSSSFPVPQANGYDDFVHASAMVRGDLRDTYSDQQALEMYVSENAGVYALAQSGLGKSSRVTVQTSRDWGTAHANEVGRLKNLTHCLIAKSRLAEMEGRTNEAFDVYLETYRFAHEMSAGGLALDFLVGISCKALVLDRFKALIPNLTSPQRKEALRVIDSIESEEEDAQVVHRRMRRWQNAALGLRWRVERWRKTVEEIVQSRSLKPLGSSRRLLLDRLEIYEKQYINPIRDQLQRSQVTDPGTFPSAAKGPPSP